MKITNKHLPILLAFFFVNILFSSSLIANEWEHWISVDTMHKKLKWFNETDTIQVDPVCGSDGNTYLNSKEAQFFGINHWSEGACGTYKQVIAIKPDLMWITEVRLNEMHQTSQFESDGFTNFNNVMMEVYKARENVFTLKKQTANPTTENCLKVWIDYDENGKFDATELVIHETGENCTKSQKFKLPEPIPFEFTTIMRVFYGTTEEAPESGFIEKGEVEDYSLIVY